MTVPGSLADAFVLLHDYLFIDGDRDNALRRLVGLAVTSIPGCDHAAVTAWPLNREPRSLASSDDVAQAADELQYQVGDGPCLAAATDSEVVRVDDLTTDNRWPTFGARAASDTPVRAVLSFHLVDIPQRSALNLYAREVKAFGDESLTVASLFAAHARVLLVHAASAQKAVNLEHALSTSRQIGAAIGILMNVRKITNEQAFELLRTSSQHLHRKLHDIADEVTQTGTLPDHR